MITRELNNTGAPLTLPNGTPAAGARITFTLVTNQGVATDVFDADTYERISPGPVSVVTDATGVFSIYLWPTSRGNKTVFYLCQVSIPSVSDLVADLPDGTGALSWIIFALGGAPPTPPILDALALHIGDPAPHQGATLYPLDLIAKGPWVDSRAYSSLALADAAAYAAGKQLLIATPYTVSSSTTLYSAVKIIPGGSISVASGQTLAFAGTFEAPPFQYNILRGPGSFSFTTVLTVYAEWFGAVADGTTDCYSAIVAAINSMPGYYNPSTLANTFAYGTDLQFGVGRYYLSQTLNLKKQVIMRGAGPGFTSGFNTTLAFADNIDGIVLHAANTGTGVGSAEGSVLENMAIIRTGDTSGTYGSGIWMRIKASLKNIAVGSFRGNGIQIIASAGAGGTSEGNANNWYLDHVRTVSNGGDGLYVDGADANAGNCYALDSEYNGGYGVNDSSFLGNTYIGAHTASNTSGSYKTDSATANNVFVGCYTEGGEHGPFLVKPTLVIGGTGMTRAIGTDNLANIVQSNNLSSPMTIQSVDGQSTVTVGSGGSTAGVMQMMETAHPAAGYNTKHQAGMWYTEYNNGGGHVSEIWTQDASKANGAARDIASSPYTSLINLNHFALYGRVWWQPTTTPTTPVAGYTYELGDVIPYATPSAGGYLGAICTTAGTGGTLSGVTATTTAGSPTVTVNTTTGLKVGSYITIAGVSGVNQIRAISGTTLTMAVNVSSTISGAAVSYSAPVLKTWGAISP